MGEIQAALDRAVLETGVAVITPEMAFRDVRRELDAAFAEWRASQGEIAPAALAHPRLLELAELEEAARDALYGSQVNPMCVSRATPARPLRVRLCLDEHGPGWLGLLTQCAWLRGGILPDAPP